MLATGRIRVSILENLDMGRDGLTSQDSSESDANHFEGVEAGAEESVLEEDNVQRMDDTGSFVKDRKRMIGDDIPKGKSWTTGPGHSFVGRLPLI
jgi:hypothetical protein